MNPSPRNVFAALICTLIVGLGLLWVGLGGPSKPAFAGVGLMLAIVAGGCIARGCGQ